MKTHNEHTSRMSSTSSSINITLSTSGMLRSIYDDDHIHENMSESLNVQHVKNTFKNREWLQFDNNLSC